ncbi:MAG: CvpA family protein [Planctomycetota bacterium]|nr:CvpA family protein [Planctomycetota bacterium]
MVLILLATVLILAVAFYQVTQGLFSAMIMTILTVLSAAAAFNFYEPLASMLYARQPAYADAAALIAVFVVPLLVLRIGYDKLIGSNVVFGIWADRIGGGLLGLITGIILIGVLAIALQMLPFGAKVMTYQPFDDALQRKQRLLPFCPDELTAGMAKMLSAGAFSSDRAYGTSHDDLLLELYCARNRYRQHRREEGQNIVEHVGRVDSPPDALQVLSVHHVDFSLAGWLDDLPKNPLLDTIETTKAMVVRVSVAASARDDDNWWRLPATHFRLVCQSGRSFYPLGYLTYVRTERPAWQLIAAPVENKLAQIGALAVPRPWKNEMESLTVDWVYRVPTEQEPAYVVFRRTARAGIANVTKTAPPATGALERGRMLKPTRKRRRR